MNRLWMCGLIVLTLCFSVHAKITSEDLTKKAWAAFEIKNWHELEKHAMECIRLFESKAREQQASLQAFPSPLEAPNYWALNDVGTCYFILGKMFQEKRQYSKLTEISITVKKNFGFAQCYDPKGFYWKITTAFHDMMVTVGTNIDYGDYTSATLVGKAWVSLNGQNFESAIIYADKCVSLYMKEAKEQQSSLNSYPSEATAFDYWALNDVGTAHFILGEAFHGLGSPEQAGEHYQKVLTEYSFAQCYNSQGFFWKVATVAGEKLSQVRSKAN